MNEQRHDPDPRRGEPPSGLPDGEDEVTPLGPAADEEEADGHGRGRDGEELPGLPTAEPDTAE